MFPIRLGTDGEFAALREALEACDYTEPAICSRFQIRHVSELPAKGAVDSGVDRLGLLIRLFIQGGAIDPSAASDLPMRELEALGLITRADRIFASAMLYPTRGVYVASDRTCAVDSGPFLPPEDIVYPAIVPTTDFFLDSIPPAKCDAFLDLCAGAGVAALEAAQSGARHAWAFDITARSTHFAEFNRRLNAISNMTPAQGDLYEPAGEQTFDRIVAHPPYIPVYRPRFVFDSGGQDGEQVVRRIVEGLPRYLRPGGRFYALTMGSDREQPFENRLREWLGDAQREFDVAFMVHRAISPQQYSSDAVVLHKGAVEDIAGWRELFHQWGVRSLAYGIVVIERRESDRAVFTIRRAAGPKTGPAEFVWLVEWAAAALDTGKVLHAKPRARANVSLRVDHRFVDGAWQPESFRLESEYPFSATMRAEPWAAHLLTVADGSLTVQQLLDRLKSDEVLPGSAPPVEFARAVAALISAGLLELDEWPLPSIH